MLVITGIALLVIFRGCRKAHIGIFQFVETGATTYRYESFENHGFFVLLKFPLLL